jgi:thiamine-phosphate pyrophosphorylase
LERAGFRLYLITDRKLAARHGGLPAALAAALSAAASAAPPGTVAVQLREKDLGARELYELACALRACCTRYGAPLIVNDRLDVALAAGADGVHLPGDSFAISDARRLMGPTRLIGVSTHQPDEVAAAEQAGADFAVYGPVYAPLSKALIGAERGVEGFAAALHASQGMPVYALGGITAARARELAGAAALGEPSRPSGVGVIGSVFSAEDPAAATRELLQVLADLQS